MEKHIKRKVDQYQVQYKTDQQKWIQDRQVQLTTPDGVNVTSEYFQYVFDYENPTFLKEDFQKRKRVKNIVEQGDRCIARRAKGGGEQCTRRRREMQQFCGTHCKSQPHGIAIQDTAHTKPLTKIDMWVQDIKGINYYIDSNNNVYKPEDIVSNKPNPAVIAQWLLSEANVYTIPAFGI
jgi:hypothetical protein